MLTGKAGGEDPDLERDKGTKEAQMVQRDVWTCHGVV